MANEGYGPAGAEFDDAPFLDSDESGVEEDYHEFDGEEDEDDQGVG